MTFCTVPTGTIHAREDQIATARGQYLLTGLDALICHQAGNLQLPCRVAL